VGVAGSDRVILEDVVSGRALADSPAPHLPRPCSARRVRAGRDDPAAAELIDHSSASWAMHVVNLAVAIDPSDRLGGGMMRSWLDRPRSAAALRRSCPLPPELVREFPYDAPLIGALALGLEAAGNGTSEHSDLAPQSTRRPWHEAAPGAAVCSRPATTHRHYQ